MRSLMPLMEIVLVTAIALFATAVASAIHTWYFLPETILHKVW